MDTHKGSIIPQGGQRIVGIILSSLLRWKAKTQKGGAACPRSPRELIPEVGLVFSLLDPQQSVIFLAECQCPALTSVA